MLKNAFVLTDYIDLGKFAILTRIKYAFPIYAHILLKFLSRLIMRVTEFAALIWLVTGEVQVIGHSSYFRPLFKQANVVFE